MAEGMNKVLLLGNVGADPELRVTSGGQSVLKIRLATSESYLDKNRVRQEKTEWHSVVVWGKQGESLAKFLQKGSKVMVEGANRTTSYEKDGSKVWKTEVVAQKVMLCGGAGAQGRGQEQKRQPGEDKEEDDFPAEY